MGRRDIDERPPRRWTGANGSSRGPRTVLAAVAVLGAASVVDGSQSSAASSIVDAHGPSVSADGRQIVFGGRVDGRSSVFRVTLDTGVVDELSVVPAGVRSGDTIHGRISSDGCAVVATTQIAFDLFRDDDRGDRWDVYRLVLPECGGRTNAWELVSADIATGAAMDGVDVDDAPSMSATGTLVAFTHPARGLPEGLSTITLVDVTVPVGDRSRFIDLAGLPAEPPNTAFGYRGARQPALSDNGRHLAFVADFTAAALLPGWADGPVPGGPATSQVYVWDRLAGLGRRGVALVSGREGVESRSGGSSPSISEDGRIVAFVSADPLLVAASFPPCRPDCPSQVFRLDRDTDGNGLFDEPSRADPLSIVSATSGGFGPPVAGNRSSWSPAVGFDGGQIVFVTDATDLVGVGRGGGGSPTDGDLLVAEHHLGTLRRVLDDPSEFATPGAHGRPAMSRTGGVVAFDTVVPADAFGDRSIVPIDTVGRTIGTVRFEPALSMSEVDFGTVLVGFESAELYAMVRNAGPSAFEPSEVTVSGAFRVTGGTCRRGVVVAAGQSCSVRLTFRPSSVGRRSGTLSVRGVGPGDPVVSAPVSGSGGVPALLVRPGGVDLPSGVVGSTAGRTALDVENTGFAPVDLAELTVVGVDASDFVIVGDSCRGRALNPDATCAVEIEFRPTGVGYRTALLVARAGSLDPSAAGSYTAAVLGGYAVHRPSIRLPGGVSVRPGEAVEVVGSGFPALQSVIIGFGVGSPPLATVTADESGSFTALVDLPIRVAGGPRSLVASGPIGAVAVTRVVVVRRPISAVPGIPGFGLG